MTDEERMERIFSAMERGKRTSEGLGLDLNSKQFKTYYGPKPPNGIMDVTRDDMTFG